MQTTLHGVHIGLNGMNPLDWTIALTLAISTVTAFMRGLIRSLVSLGGLIVGIVAAAWYAPRLAHYLMRWIASLAFAEVAAFVLILAAVYLLAALLGRVLRGAFSAVGLGFLDRLGGAAFGFARGVLLLAAVLLPFSPYLQHFRAVRTSLLFPYLLPVAHGISFVVPRDLGQRTPMTDWLHHADTDFSAPIKRRSQQSRGEYE